MWCRPLFFPLEDESLLMSVFVLAGDAELMFCFATLVVVPTLVVAKTRIIEVSILLLVVRGIVHVELAVTVRNADLAGANILGEMRKQIRESRKAFVNDQLIDAVGT